MKRFSTSCSFRTTYADNSRQLTLRTNFTHTLGGTGPILFRLPTMAIHVIIHTQTNTCSSGAQRPPSSKGHKLPPLVPRANPSTLSAPPSFSPHASHPVSCWYLPLPFPALPLTPQHLRLSALPCRALKTAASRFPELPP